MTEVTFPPNKLANPVINGNNPESEVVGVMIPVPLLCLVPFVAAGVKVGTIKFPLEVIVAAVAFPDPRVVVAVDPLLTAAVVGIAIELNPIKSEIEARIPVGVGAVTLLTAVGAVVLAKMVEVAITTTGELVPFERMAEVVVITID